MESSGANKEAKYAHGHDDTVLRSHLWRTVENSCAYLLPYIKPSMKILDLGCGPGNITCGLAKLVPEGSAIGLDRAEDVVEKARAYAASTNQTNVTFVTGNIFKLDYPDDQFDIVHVHQVLQHVGDASAAVKEMRRVCKPGGIVAARESCEFLHYPPTPELDLLIKLVWTIMKGHGGLPQAGLMLRKFARESGFQPENVNVMAGTWCYSTEKDLDYWCSMWADRVLSPEFKKNAISTGLISEKGLVEMSEALRRFITQEDACYTVVHGEMICHK